MARFDLADFEWSMIEPLSPNKPRGVPRVDDRRVPTSSRCRKNVPAFSSYLYQYRNLVERFSN